MSQNLEMKVQNYMRLKEEMKSLELRLESEKDGIGAEMARIGEDEVLVPWNDEQDIKVKRGPSNRKTLDKESLAEVLRVDESVIKPDFLMKSVDEDKLTYSTYKDSFYENKDIKVAVRLVKA